MMQALLAVFLFQAAEGTLVVAGGGGLPDEVLKRTLELAGGEKAAVVVVPQASGRKDAGRSSAEYWRKAGASTVTILDPERPEVLEKADLIWMTGGSQSRLMNALENTRAPDLIRKRYREGAVIGGSSAGAAVQSGIMITGDSTPPGKGLALDARVIFDQHFIARRRFTRLLEEVLKNPTLVGIGIDEGTAVVVKGGRYEVIGRSRILVIDARKAEKGRNVALHFLGAGESFSLK